MAKYLVSWQDKHQYFFEKEKAKIFLKGIEACGHKVSMVQVETLQTRLEKKAKKFWLDVWAIVKFMFAGLVFLAILGMFLGVIGAIGAILISGLKMLGVA